MSALFETNAHLLIPGHDLVEQLNNAKDQKTCTISYESFLDIIHTDLVQNVKLKGEENYNATSNPNLRSKSLELRGLIEPISSSQNSLKDLGEIEAHPEPKLQKTNSAFNGLTDPKLTLSRVVSDRRNDPAAALPKVVARVLSSPKD